MLFSEWCLCLGIWCTDHLIDFYEESVLHAVPEVSLVDVHVEFCEFVWFF